MTFECAVGVCAVRRGCLERALLVSRKRCEIVKKCSIVANYDIDIALRINIRVIAIRTLEKYLEITARFKFQLTVSVNPLVVVGW